MFQFQSGAIKREDAWNYLRFAALFQFQSGAIKSQRLVGRFIQFTEFQFQSGAIKSQVLARQKNAQNHVSIPIWCD